MGTLVFQGITGAVGMALLALGFTLWATSTWGDAFWLILMFSMYANGLSLGRAFGS